ncbi:hypothetical protein [Streptomyces longisporoflavus]|uniref:hypothetical protein n=1 Tax=Streptomyces longisporoflavus TaxID=28044 RepID=UPI001E316BC5|nr:hypothetical protein [Streptomyces longisporoflavus]
MCTAGALTACSGSGDKSEDSKPPATPSASNPETSPTPSKSDDPEAKDKQAVLKVYERMWEEQVKAYAKGSIDGTNLKDYSTKDALGRVMGDLLGMKQADTVTKGAPSHDTEVTSLDLRKEIPKARLSDCLDISEWKTVKRGSGEVQPLPSEQPSRFETTIDAEKWGKKWMITGFKPSADPCKPSS